MVALSALVFALLLRASVGLDYAVTLYAPSSTNCQGDPISTQFYGSNSCIPIDNSGQYFFKYTCGASPTSAICTDSLCNPANCISSPLTFRCTGSSTNGWTKNACVNPIPPLPPNAVTYTLDLTRTCTGNPIQVYQYNLTQPGVCTPIKGSKYYSKVVTCSASGVSLVSNCSDSACTQCTLHTDLGTSCSAGYTLFRANCPASSDQSTGGGGGGSSTGGGPSSGNYAVYSSYLSDTCSGTPIGRFFDMTSCHSGENWNANYVKINCTTSGFSVYRCDDANCNSCRVQDYANGCAKVGAGQSQYFQCTMDPPEAGGYGDVYYSQTGCSGTLQSGSYIATGCVGQGTNSTRVSCSSGGAALEFCDGNDCSLNCVTFTNPTGCVTGTNEMVTCGANVLKAAASLAALLIMCTMLPSLTAVFT